MATRSRNTVVKLAGRSSGKLPPSGKTPSTGSEIFLELRRRIATQELPPGSKLRELELAAEFGVPRPRVREALASLEQRGLVERIPNRGAVVTRLDFNQVMAVYQAREVLEGLCVRLATERAPRGSWDDLVEKFETRMGQYLQAGEFEEFVAGYEDFRKRVFDAAANPVVQDMLNSIVERTQMIIRRMIILPGRAERGLEQHRAVLKAMQQGDAERAEALRRENLRDAAEYFRRYHRFLL